MQSNTLSRNWTVGGGPSQSSLQSNLDDFLQNSRTLDSRSSPSHSRPGPDQRDRVHSWAVQDSPTQSGHNPPLETNSIMEAFRTLPGIFSILKTRVANPFSIHQSFLIYKHVCYLVSTLQQIKNFDESCLF